MSTPGLDLLFRLQSDLANITIPCAYGRYPGSFLRGHHVFDPGDFQPVIIGETVCGLSVVVCEALKKSSIPLGGAPPA